MNGRLILYPSAEALARAEADTIALLLNEAIHARSHAMIALSGGTTPRRVYELLASEPLRSAVRWESVHVFWGDERCVPPEHPDSNYRMANEALLRHVTIPDGNVHRIQGELKPDEAAPAYEEDLRRTFRLGPDDVPRFDLVLLGLGDDGHTASLFPGGSSLKERQRLVTTAYVERLGAYRVTLTYRTINNAGNVHFLVSGKSKAAILARVVQSSAEEYPAQLVRPFAGDLRWLVDQDAASQLEPVRQS